jgi:hypothetical protein
MAALDDALQLASKDPPVGFVALAVAGAKAPSPSIRVVTKGRTIVLPAWTGSEWGWYGQLALALASKLDAKNPVAQRDKDVAAAKLLAIHPAMQALGSALPSEKQAFAYYDAAVRLVIAANAAASGPTRAQLALEAFGSAVVEAPRTILNGITKDIPREAAGILSDIFLSAVGGLKAPVLIIGAVVLFLMLNKKGR